MAVSLHVQEEETRGNGAAQVRATAAREEDEDENSPIEQVRLTVSTADDPSLPVWTFRMWFLGLLSCALMSFLNQFFAYRTEKLAVTQISVQVASLPAGHFLARVLPRTKFRLPGFGDRLFSLNPGPFNMKEHVLISIFANPGYTFAKPVTFAYPVSMPCSWQGAVRTCASCPPVLWVLELFTFPPRTYEDIDRFNDCSVKQSLASSGEMHSSTPSPSREESELHIHCTISCASPASTSPSPSTVRLWKPAPQRNLMNQWSSLLSSKRQWELATSEGRSGATMLINAYLSRRYLPNMNLGVLKDMSEIRQKACKKLSQKHVVCITLNCSKTVQMYQTVSKGK